MVGDVVERVVAEAGRGVGHVALDPGSFQRLLRECGVLADACFDGRGGHVELGGIVVKSDARLAPFGLEVRCGG